MVNHEDKWIYDLENKRWICLTVNEDLFIKSFEVHFEWYVKNNVPIIIC